MQWESQRKAAGVGVRVRRGGGAEGWGGGRGGGHLLVGLLALDALLSLPFPLQGVLSPPLSVLLPEH